MKTPTKPKKASQVSSKGKAAPAQSKARGGAPAVKDEHSEWEEITKRSLIEQKTAETPERIEYALKVAGKIRSERRASKPTAHLAAPKGLRVFDNLLAMMPDEKRSELENLRAELAPGLEKFASILAQGNERFAQMVASCVQDSVTFDEATTAQAAYHANPSRVRFGKYLGEGAMPAAGLPLAAWEVTLDDAGFTLAAEVAAKLIKPPTDSHRKAQNLAASAGRDLTSKAGELTQGERQIVLEEVATWLSEPESTGKARYKRLFFNAASGSLKFFTPRSRFRKKGERLQADILSLSQRAARDVIKMLKVEEPPEAVLVGINNHQAATLEFVTRFIQKHTGKSGEMLESRAEWLEDKLCGLPLPQPKGSAEEQEKVKRRRKSISSWAKKRVRED